MTDISRIALGNNAYKTVGSSNFGSGIPDLKESTSMSKDFHKIFNNYDKMSSEQILEIISEKGVVHPNLGIAGEALRKLNKDLNSSKQVLNKSLLNESSFLDLSFSANKSRHVLEAVVKFRDTMLQSLDKIFNMQI